MVAYVEDQLGAVGQESDRRVRRFPWSLRGYRRSAVDQHIAMLESELSELDRELVELRVAATLREEVAHEMRRICQETASIVIEAHSEAQRLVGDATSRANEITAHSETRVRELEAQLAVVQQDRDRLLENALAVSAGIADVVHAAHQQVPALAATEPTAT